ncbi:MAG: ATP-binding protein [Synechococcus sp. SB0668_bin_15]|nr:ATP-binding protein [Synechococcus sp. SB0668_bin_15]MYC49939.1 ATP-binding protein [Synechococcus sp. SB0662_bin_14]
MLKRLELENVGPAPRMELNLAPRLNLVTGDNGLGKSFLLDVAWWALTRKWPRDLNPRLMSGYQARPTDIGSPACLRFTVEAVTGSKSYESKYSPPDESWTGRPGRPLNPGLVVHAHVDGGFSVWDPARNYWKKKGDIDVQDRLPGYVFSAEDVWNGLEVVVSQPQGTPRTTKVCKGLLEDWSDWIKEGGDNAERMTRVLDQLAVQEEPLAIGPVRQLTVDDIRDIPSIRTTYAAEVLIVHASSALRRIIALAYMLVWSWSRHVSAAAQLGCDRARQVILLFDEVDAHLHPRWQRTIIPAILEVMNSLTTDEEETVPVQIIAATHSPLVLASVEPHFDEDRDRLFHLDIRDRQVHLDEVQWAKQGDVLNWLVSDTFGLLQGRSLEAERAIEAAKALMDQTGAEAVAKRDPIHQELQRVLPGHDPFWPRWVVWVERQAAQQ